MASVRSTSKFSHVTRERLLITITKWQLFLLLCIIFCIKLVNMDQAYKTMLIEIVGSKLQWNLNLMKGQGTGKICSL